MTKEQPTLQRVPWQQINADPLYDQLAREAELLLGYSQLRKKLNSPGPLAFALMELEIIPFSPESVALFQEHAAELANKKNRKEFPGTMSSIEWERTPLNGYGKDVEPHVIARALSVTKHLSGVVFWVEELGGDPFLVATCGEEEFYVDAWSEDGFVA